MTDAVTDFGSRLDLALKILNISRGALAAEARVDKSLVSRWARGLAAPRGHNLAALTAIVKARLPGFTQLDWDLPLAEFNQVLGLGRLSEAPERADSPGLPDRLQAARLQSRHEVAREGGAYPGVYVGFRQSTSNTGRVIADLMIIWRDGDQLFYRVRDLMFSVQGEVQILDHSLFLQGAGEGRVEALMYHVLHGVQGPKALRLDGLVMALRPDRFRTPAATSIVLQRLEDLAVEDRPPSQERIAMIIERLHTLEGADEITSLAGPAVIRAITPREAFGPTGDHLLLSPAERSLAAGSLEWSDELEADLRRLRRVVLDRDDLYPIFAAPDRATS